MKYVNYESYFTSSCLLLITQQTDYCKAQRKIHFASAEFRGCPAQ